MVALENLQMTLANMNYQTNSKMLTSVCWIRVCTS